MPSRESGKRVRLPSIAAKIYAITGMSRDEKGLLRRVANLIDALVVQRDISNPDTKARKISDRVPTPQNVAASTIIGGAEITWDPVDFNRFESYDVEHSSSSTFANSTTLSTFTTRIVIKNLTQTTFVRVRTVSRTGEVSLFASPVGGGISIQTSLFDVDTDHIDPENRTRIDPTPELLGKSLDVGGVSDKAFVGVGGAVGPGPITFVDPSGNATDRLKNQITYSLEELNTVVQSRTMNLPVSFYDGFYDTFERLYTTPTGTFIDFFDLETLGTDPDTLDILFLQYLQLPHEQTGVVSQATMSIIKL